MATVIRPVISENNRYWIDKHRHYELKHFCLQYPSWKKAYTEMGKSQLKASSFDQIPSGNIPGDPTGGHAVKRVDYSEKIRLIEKVAKEADDALHDYILKAVTEGLSYTYLKTAMSIPCGRDTYYDRYRRFFWILSNARG